MKAETQALCSDLQSGPQWPGICGDGVCLSELGVLLVTLEIPILHLGTVFSFNLADLDAPGPSNRPAMSVDFMSSFLLGHRVRQEVWA